MRWEELSSVLPESTLGHLRAAYPSGMELIQVSLRRYWGQGRVQRIGRFSAGCGWGLPTPTRQLSPTPKYPCLQC